MAAAFTIRPAAPDEMSRAATLFQEYADSLAVGLAYQGFETERATLPGAYAPPRGALLIALLGTAPVGCVAIRPIGPATCEMKRLHTTPTARGKGIGRALAQAAIRAATEAGYASICLDTLPDMIAAQALYRQLGFHVTRPYYASPVPGTIFMNKRLIETSQ